MNELCPRCKVELDRKYGLPGIVSTCLKCGEEWVKYLDKLVSREEFHKMAEIFNG